MHLFDLHCCNHGLLSLKHEKKYNCDNTIEMVQYIQIEKEFDYV